MRLIHPTSDLALPDHQPAEALPVGTPAASDMVIVIINPFTNPTTKLSKISDISGGGGGGTGGLVGAGAPEGVVTANAGTTYLNTLNDDFYVKKSGSGNTGWVGLILS